MGLILEALHGPGDVYAIELLAAKLDQPIYLFKNGKFYQAYGKGGKGTPITIVYDAESEHYSSLVSRGSSGENNCLYDAISVQTKVLVMLLY